MLLKYICSSTAKTKQNSPCKLTGEATNFYDFPTWRVASHHWETFLGRSPLREVPQKWVPNSTALKLGTPGVLTSLGGGVCAGLWQGRGGPQTLLQASSMMYTAPLVACKVLPLFMTPPPRSKEAPGCPECWSAVSSVSPPPRPAREVRTFGVPAALQSLLPRQK